MYCYLSLANKHMEAFLIAAYDDGVPFKSLRNTVKDIKYFRKLMLMD